MFGIKFIKEESYEELMSLIDFQKSYINDLKRNVNDLNDVICEKNSLIDNLKSENESLNQKFLSLKVANESNVILLTDVAESSLVVENETVKPKKKSAKKSGTKTVVKKAVSKEVVED